MKHLTTKYVLGFLFAIVVASLFVTTFTACEDNDEKPPAVVDPVKPVDPTPTPVGVEPTPKPSDVDPNAEYCKEEGKKFNCGNPVWYGLKGCKPDSDGDNHAEGTAYFATLAEIESLAEKNNVTIRIKMKDGSNIQYGVGFAAPCAEM